MMAPFASPAAAYRVQEATDDDLAWVVERFVRPRPAQRRGRLRRHRAARRPRLPAARVPLPAQQPARPTAGAGRPRRRAELFTAVVRAVRAEVGPTFPLWARVGTFEAHRGPGPADSTTRWSPWASASMPASTPSTSPPTASRWWPPASPTATPPTSPARCSPTRPGCGGELGVPVIAMGRLTPEAAEQALADGVADVIAMGRPLIADPDLPNKLARGQRHRIRPCTYQYQCIGAIFLNAPVQCAVNPEAGHEADAAPVPAERPRHVVVAGGGPGGAGVRSPTGRARAPRRAVGGERSPRRPAGARRAADPDLAGLLAWLVGGAEDAGVTIRLGQPVDRARGRRGARVGGRRRLAWRRRARGGRPARVAGGHRSPGRSRHRRGEQQGRRVRGPAGAPRGSARSPSCRRARCSRRSWGCPGGSGSSPRRRPRESRLRPCRRRSPDQRRTPSAGRRSPSSRPDRQGRWCTSVVLLGRLHPRVRRCTSSVTPTDRAGSRPPSPPPPPWPARSDCADAHRPRSRRTDPLRHPRAPRPRRLPVRASAGRSRRAARSEGGQTCGRAELRPWHPPAVRRLRRLGVEAPRHPARRWPARRPRLRRSDGAGRQDPPADAFRKQPPPSAG